MKYIYVDTSSKKLFLGVYKDLKLLSSVIVPSFKDINEKLVENFDFMLNNINISLNDIDNFIVNVGPGSFTGIRIGVSFLQGLCLGLNKICHGISAFDIAALSLNKPKITIGIKLIGKFYGVKEYNFEKNEYGDSIQVTEGELENYEDLYLLDGDLNPLIGLQSEKFMDFLCEPIPFYMRKSEAEINFDKKSQA